MASYNPNSLIKMLGLNLKFRIKDENDILLKLCDTRWFLGKLPQFSFFSERARQLL